MFLLIIRSKQIRTRTHIHTRMGLPNKRYAVLTDVNVSYYNDNLIVIIKILQIFHNRYQLLLLNLLYFIEFSR